MAFMKPLNIVEVCEISPATSTPESSTESLSHPLTCFDTIWFKFHPVERLFFYTLTDADPAFFNSVILNKLKQSLSIALVHFLPLAGKLIWPSNADAPFLRYSVKDGVFVTVAVSNADFIILSGFQPRKADDSHHYVPELPVSDSEASAIALQITLFPNQGFCIGLSSHHAILDGKSSAMFMKAWAHICRHLEEGTYKKLPTELTPFFDRTLIRDPGGYRMKFLDFWSGYTCSRSLRLASTSSSRPDMVRATFRLSREDIEKLREKVLCELKKDSDDEKQQLYFSTFVLTYSYTMVSMLKAKGEEKNTVAFYAIAGDCRSRMENPVPPNYFGNCVTGWTSDLGESTAESYMKENGIALAANNLRNMVKKLKAEKVEAQLQRSFEVFQKAFLQAKGFVSVAGSQKFGVYGTDFGWGRPKMVEITSAYDGSTFSLAESGDGSGGVEVGLALKEHQMEIFQTVFTDGLKAL